MKNIFNPRINIDKEAIYKRMKVSENSRIYDTINEIFDKCLERAISKINFETMFLTKDNSLEFSIKEVNDCEKIVFCFASIGKEICHEINGDFENSNYLEGYLLNEISNEIIMQATNQMYTHIKSEMRSQGYNLTKRYSPGECSFEMKYQVKIMEELKKEFEIQASLTESFMINPEKSTLFLYGADKNIPELEVDFDCSTCKAVDCPYKRID